MGCSRVSEFQARDRQMGLIAARRTRPDLRKKEEGKRKKEEGRRKKEEGRRKKEEGRRKKEEGRRKKEEGKNKTISFSCFFFLPNFQFSISDRKSGSAGMPRPISYA